MKKICVYIMCVGREVGKVEWYSINYNYVIIIINRW